MKGKSTLALLMSGLMLVSTSIPAFAEATIQKPMEEVQEGVTVQPLEELQNDYSAELYGTPDSQPPILNSIKIDKLEVAPGETVAITLGVSDDISGISHAWAHFENKATGKSTDQYTDSDNSRTITLKISEHEPSGVIELTAITLWDKVGNYITYSKVPYEGEQKLPNEISFEIKNPVVDNEDKTAPILNEIKIIDNKTEIEAPGTVKITLDVSDDISGVSHAWAHFENKATGKLIDQYTDSDDSRTITLKISEHEPSGVIELTAITLWDKVGNYITYSKVPYEGEQKLSNDVSFFVKNTDETTGDVITSTTSPSIVEDINNMAEGKTAHIYYGNNDTLKAEVFEAIKGQDKNIVLESNGIQWIFNGKDITNPKDILLNTKLSDKYENQEINDQIDWEQHAMILHFAENGQLPGKATIKIKADYTFKDVVGKDNLYVYYYDNTNKTMVTIAENLSVSKDDQYLEFTIDHNSDYVITQGPWKKPENPVDPVDPEPSKPDTGDTTVPETPSITPVVPSSRPVYSDREETVSVVVATHPKENKILVNGTPLKDSNGKVTPAEFKKLLKKYGKDAVLKFDSVNGKKVEARLFVKAEDAAKLKKSIYTRAEVSPNYKDNRTALRRFEKTFGNKNLKAITLRQKDNFNMDVTLGVKMTQKEIEQYKDGYVYLYSFNVKTNKYKSMGKVLAKLDKDGFLRFTTDRGNTFILSDKPLQKTK